MAMAYYNENDPFAAEALRQLIYEGHIANGCVDERSIHDVTPGDLNGFKQAHFFAGIGGWSLALRQAQIPDWYPLWTGSPPCQPFSQANKRRRAEDPRNLWPVWHRLIVRCKPSLIFGEQVPNAIRYGWLDAVRSDMEAQGYAFGAMVLGAHSAGAPQIRQRIYFVADSYLAPGLGSAGQVSSAQAGTEGSGHEYRRQPDGYSDGCAHCLRTVADADGQGTDRHAGEDEGPGSEAGTELLHRGEAGFWSRRDYLPFSDGSYRPVEPGTFPLVARVSRGLGPCTDLSLPDSLRSTAEARPQRVRAYGNSIVPQVAAMFIRHYLKGDY